MAGRWFARAATAAVPPARGARDSSLIEESWFSALDVPTEVGGAGGVGAEAQDPATESIGRRVPGHALRRIFATYIAARAALGVALSATVLLIALSGGRPLAWLGWPVLLCGAYAALALVWWLSGRLRGARGLASGERQWMATIGVDLVAFGLLHINDPFSTLNFGALLVLPVLMAGVLTPRLPALATSAAVALMLLATAAHAGLAGSGDLAALMSQAGLSGVGLFVVALLSGELSMRLAHEERTAQDSRERARQQAQLSRLVIEDMADGVLVIDRHLRVRAANPAVRQLLVADLRVCPPPPFSLRLHPGWLPLVEMVEQAFAQGAWPAPTMELSVMLEDGVRRGLQIRGRFTRGRGAAVVAEPGSGADPGDPDSTPVVAAGERLCVLFVEELRAVQSRMRQERLAAMGRISAGIAHEIRNPLAAIAQANALLEEDELRPDQRRLVQIMNDNIHRLKRIVDDVMEAAPGTMTPSRPLDINAEVSAICSEWARTVGLSLGNDSRLEVRLPAATTGVLFDTDHLRRVLLNLLDNAIRHATPAPRAVRLSLRPTPDEGWVRLGVYSDGEPIPADVEPYLFEPFHSTRSRGTGLGLYICRELCERHGARIDFRRRADRHCNVFEVLMRREPLLPPADRLLP